MKGDLIMWLFFLKNHNGVSVFRDQLWVFTPDLELFTDAAGSIGMGIYVNGKLGTSEVDNFFQEEANRNNITFLEFFPIVVALHLFGEELKNKRFVFHCDNIAVVEIINQQTNKCPLCNGFSTPSGATVHGIKY
jgi:hypothetical protein